MVKKKKPRKRKPDKPLFSVTGILHLQKSFVPPTEESGLLNTVGGGLESQALVLAPNYGYGISSSVVSQLEKNAEEAVKNPNIVHVNGVTTITTDKNLIELNEDLPKQDKNKNQPPPDTMTIAELVRSIGGAKDKPFMRSDVVADADKDPTTSGNNRAPETAMLNHPEENEFYESLGISRSTQESGAPVNEASLKKEDSTIVEQDVNTAVAEYYKTYCQYYYSVEPEPFGDKPLDIGPSISAEDKGNENDQNIIELARMAQRAKRAMEAATLAAEKVYGPFLPVEQQADTYDPLPMEVIPSETDAVISKDTTMDQYWEYVKENPRDFNRWTYLIQNSENTKNLVECRKAYRSFLPLFPYCFGYWKRYCEIEKSHLYYQRALSILMRGLEFNPLSIDLWQSYLRLFKEVYSQHDNFQNNMREQYEKAVGSAGMDFRSDAVWDEYIDWETNNNNLKAAFVIYRRLLNVPTRLYNRHWDNVYALVRDHHPRDFLYKEEYELLRKKGCKKLKYKYNEEPDYEPGEIIKTTKPEDKLMNYVKEKIISKLEKRRAQNEIETEKRWLYEDKIKRPYFHVKPLDNGQLRNWENYLNFEISEGLHDRTVLLFERCLIACALYERFWVKYARYLEKYHRLDVNANKEVCKHFQRSQISFDIGSRKELIEEEALVATVTLVLKEMIDKVVEEEEYQKKEISGLMQSMLNTVCDSSYVDSKTGHDMSESVSSKSVTLRDLNKVSTEATASVALGGHSSQELPPSSVEGQTNDGNDVSSLTTQLSVPAFPPTSIFWHDIIRDVYKRACVVHCPRKPTIRLQWAAFEEEIGNMTGAKQLIQHCIEWFPDLLDAKSQMIELERRCGNHDEVIKLFEEYLKKSSSSSAFSLLSIKYARFLYKEQGKPEKALAVLRKAVKKDKGNHLLYSYVFDICHERFPTDRKGASAALELAVQSKDLKNEYKLQFLKKKVLFLQEHGDLVKYRDSLDQLYDMQELVAAEQAQEAAKLTLQQQPDIPQSKQTFPAPIWNAEQNVPINFEPVEGNCASASVEQVTENSSTPYAAIPPTSELLDCLTYSSYCKHPDSKLQEHLAQNEYDSLVSRGYPEASRDKEQPATSNSAKRRKGRKRKSDVPVFIVPPKGPYLADYLAKARNNPKR